MLSKSEKEEIEYLKKEIAGLEFKKRLAEAKINTIKSRVLTQNSSLPKYICEPQDDIYKRFLLSKKGKNNLVVICLNPNTANQFELDGTSQNIDTIAAANGYDGWVLFNLSPERASNPSLLSDTLRDGDIASTANLLRGVVDSKVIKANNVLVAWGNTVDWSFPYLKKSIVIIGEQLKLLDVNYWCIDITKSENPLHPSQQALMTKGLTASKVKLKTFDFLRYHKEMKRVTKF
ncbi:hypothetical protein MED134_07049 [Dokdonia sp. MED134]|uniref:DUF1643 domain-containing protein n=1 Tax=Dokdonia sp. MED134 TaxID=313590 RepID=UPI000068AC51|nr:DUF1643 domain-containing protein [Dokdonia sp. MED134]EAQ40493.1 hypothetical protein MED134_07049 [Dokdonia sp. MED134]